MKRRIAFGALLLFAAIELPLACSEKVPLAGMNALCEYDEQCAEGLACRCIRRRNPDDEGPDEIIAPGICQTRDYRCAGDAGVAETSPTDTGTDTGTMTDTAVPDAIDASSDVVDGD
jgi:hypothetical protein